MMGEPEKWKFRGPLILGSFAGGSVGALLAFALMNEPSQSRAIWAFPMFMLFWLFGVAYAFLLSNSTKILGDL